MGVIFTLTDDVRALATQIFDDVITEFGKVCRLVYPPKMIPCSNCSYDPVGKKSSGFWKDGTRIRGVCPYCGGNYYRAEEVYEDIQFSTEVNPKQFEKFPFEIPLKDPAGILQIKGYMVDLPKVMKSEYIIHDVNMKPYIEQRYKMYGEPISPSNIVKNRYFICLFERF
jgi:hypothetical protein